MPPVPAVHDRPAAVAGAWQGMTERHLVIRLDLAADGGGTATLTAPRRKPVTLRVREWGRIEHALLIAITQVGAAAPAPAATASSGSTDTTASAAPVPAAAPVTAAPTAAKARWLADWYALSGEVVDGVLTLQVAPSDCTCKEVVAFKRL